MKKSEFKNLIKEAVKEALDDVLNEKISQPNKPTPTLNENREALRSKIREGISMDTTSFFKPGGGFDVNAFRNQTVMESEMLEEADPVLQFINPKLAQVVELSKDKK